MDDLNVNDVPYLEEDSGEQFESREVLGIQTNLADLWDVDADLGQDVMTVYAVAFWTHLTITSLQVTKFGCAKP